MMKWHDLRKDPNDLPQRADYAEVAVVVVTETEDKRRFVDTDAYFLGDKFCMMDDDGELLPIDHSPNYDDDEKVIAWTYYSSIFYDFVEQEGSDKNERSQV